VHARSLVASVLAGLVLGLPAAAGFASGSSVQAETPKRGGHLRIARIEDSQSFDKTTVFQNESLWLIQQINESIYTATPDGKSVRPWLATGHTVTPDGKRYTFKLRRDVRFSNGQPMTSADVKFSFDDARKQDKGWGFLDVAIKNVQAPDRYTVVINLKYPWTPFLADAAVFANGVIPNNFAGKTRAEFYKAPIGTGPFMWDSRVVGRSVTFKRNPFYWQKGKPYLDRVTWTFVSDQNTRELQLRGGQIEINEFPPFNSIARLKRTPGIKMHLFPSTRTDYLVMNHSYGPLGDRHVRRAISYAIDRAAIVRSVLFGNGRPANSFMPPQVPYYDPRAPGLQYDMNKARAELAQSNFKDGFDVELIVGAGEQTDNAIGQVLQQSLKRLNINVRFRTLDTSTAFQMIQQRKYQLGFSYWTMDIADPDELVTFAVDPKGGGAFSFFTNYNNPNVVKLSKQAQRERSTAKRRSLYAQIQRLAAQDAFMAFLYYSPFRYATTDKVHGFFVYPLGNYHLENVWLS
jgi:peptide/nickel transport system substrate-binding protein